MKENVRKIGLSMVAMVLLVLVRGIRMVRHEGDPCVSSPKTKWLLAIWLFFTWIVASSFASAQGIITTVAGTGSPGFSGDGGPATQAQIYGPYELAVDGTGNLYIADRGNERVRKVDANGTITTVVGTGIRGLSPDGTLAAQAQLYAPSDVAFDSSGNLYIVGYENHRVLKVDTNGIITTVAGSGGMGDSAGSYGGDGGPATQARLYDPVSVAFDSSGNLYISDYGNRRVRKVDANGIITTVAGTGSTIFNGDNILAIQAGLGGPYGVAVDSADNLYIADYLHNRIRKVDTNGIITTVAGTGSPGFGGEGGPATQAQLNTPFRIVLDSMGSLYIVDTGNHRIRKIDVSGIITTVVGTGSPGFSGDGGPATQAQLHGPVGLTLDSTGNLYIAEDGNHRVRKVTFSQPPSLQ